MNLPTRRVSAKLWSTGSSVGQAILIKVESFGMDVVALGIAMLLTCIFYSIPPAEELDAIGP